MYFYMSPTGIWNMGESSNFKSVDTTKYDIVEKKEAKIERLKSELENAKSHEKTVNTLIQRYGEELNETMDNIDKLEKELKELENE